MAKKTKKGQKVFLTKLALGTPNMESYGDAPLLS
jgi:hypothetical protein